MKTFVWLLLSAGLLAASFLSPWTSGLVFLFLVPAMVGAVGVPAGSRRVWWGMAWGLAIFTLNFYWVLGTMHSYGRMSWWLSGLLFPLLAVYQTGPFVLWFALFPRLYRHHFVLPVVLLPLLIRAFPLVFPYTLASALATAPLWTQTAAWWGEWGLDAIIVLVNLLLFAGWRDRNRRSLLLASGMVVALLVQGWLAMPKRVPVGDTLNGLVFQPCVRDGDAPAVKEHAFFSMVQRAGDRGWDRLVIFPESSLPDRLVSRPDFIQVMQEIRKTLGARALLFTAVVYREGRMTNSAFLLDASGMLQRYDKHHLMLFGERFPLYELFRKLPIYAAQFANFSPGEHPAPMRLDDVPVWTPICLEGIFEGYNARSAADAVLIVNPTDDEWFGPAHASRLHAAQVRLKAVENRRWLVRAANTGYTMVVDPGGRLRADLPFGTPGMLPVTVGLRREITLFQRVYAVIPWLFVMALIAGWWAGRRHA